VDEISHTEIKEAIKQMKRNQTPGPPRITIEMIKALDAAGVDWLYAILNNFLNREQLPGDLKESEIMTI